MSIVGLHKIYEQGHQEGFNCEIGFSFIVYTIKYAYWKIFLSFVIFPP